MTPEEELSQSEYETLMAKERGKKGYKKFKDVIDIANDNDEIEYDFSEFAPKNNEVSEYDFSEFSPKNNEEMVKEQPEEQGNIFSHGNPEDLQRAQEEMAGGNLEFLKNIPTGAKEGLMEQLYALGNKKYNKSPIEESQYPEYSEGGRLIGELMGKTPAYVGGTMAGGAVGGLPGALAANAVLGFGTTPGDIIDRTIGGAEGAALTLLPKIPGAIKAIGKKGYETISDAFRNIKPLKHEAEIAKTNLTEAEKALSEAKTQASIATQGKSNLEVAKARAENKLSELPGEPKFPFEKRPEIHIKEAETNLENTEKLKGTMENWMSKYLKKGTAHDVNAASKIKKAFETNKKEISNEYKSIEDEAADIRIPIDNKPIIDQKTNELIEFIKNNEAYTPEARSLLKELNKLEKMPTELSAEDYLTALRSTKQYAAEARSKAYQHGLNAEERAAWEEKYNILESKADEMDKILEQSIGEDLSERLSLANQRWRTEVVPLYKNRIYQKIHHEGKIEGNIIEKLRGTDPGNILMREAIKKDPELLKDVVGQKYAKNPGELHETNELLQEYLENMPELKEMLSGHKLSLENLGKNKQLVEDAKIFEKQELDRKGFQEEIENYDKLIKELKAKAEKKDISLEEKIKSEKAYKEAKAKKVKALKKIGIVGTTIGGGYYSTKPAKLLE